MVDYSVVKVRWSCGHRNACSHYPVIIAGARGFVEGIGTSAASFNLLALLSNLPGRCRSRGALIDVYEEAWVKPSDQGDVVERLGARFGSHKEPRVRDFAVRMQEMFRMAARVGVDVYFIL